MPEHHGASSSILLDGGDVFLMGVPGGLQDHAAAAALELAKIVAKGVEHAGDAGIGEADGVHHAGWNLAHAGLWVAEPRLGGAPLRRDGAEARHVEEALELPTEAEGARRSVDGVLHLDAAEVDSHVHGTLRHYHATSSASKMGPFMQHDL